MNDNVVKIANDVAWVATMGGMVYVICKMIDRFGKKTV